MLRYPILESKFLADPSHRKKGVNRDMYGLEKQTLPVNKGLNKVDCIKMGKNFGYVVKQLPGLDKSKWVDAEKAVLEHHFENHEYCGDWCPRKSMTLPELQQDRTKTGRYYRCKERDNEVYDLMKMVMDKYVSLERLDEVGHGLDTQINESLNNTISWFAPKNKTYCGTMSLAGRIHLAIGVILMGYKTYVVELLARLGIDATPGIRKHLHNLSLRKEKGKTLHCSMEYKRKRQQGNIDNMRKQMVHAEKRRRRGGVFYRPNEGMNNCIPAPPTPVLDPKGNEVKVCPHCGKTGHVSKRSKSCDENVSKVVERAKEKEYERQANIAGNII